MQAMIWIPVTLVAATCQILRTSRQHLLVGRLGTVPAGYVRYLFALPFAVAALAATAVAVGLPAVPARFWPVVAVAGLTQILGTVALLRSFALRDFAIGTVFAKTEVVQVVIVSTVVLGEPLEPLGLVGTVLCLGGVAALAAPGRVTAVAGRLGDPAAWFGIAAGGLFAGAAVAIRAASGTMEGGAWPRAVVTLTAMLAVQAVSNGAWLAWRDRAGLLAVVAAWRQAVLVGVLSAMGSAGWALAVTLANAAKVRTLGQVEIVLAFVVAHRWGDRHRREEIVASAVVLAGIVLVVVAG